MSDTVRRHGVTLRPHLKTAKSAAVARLATAGEAGGLTVSTLAEAEYFAQNGFRDVLVANALPPM
jgi:D-serine deaminase-like pyridoxal phosphate-dependent protein